MTQRWHDYADGTGYVRHVGPIEICLFNEGQRWSMVCEKLWSGEIDLPARIDCFELASKFAEKRVSNKLAALALEAAADRPITDRIARALRVEAE